MLLRSVYSLLNVTSEHTSYIYNCPYTFTTHLHLPISSAPFEPFCTLRPLFASLFHFNNLQTYTLNDLEHTFTPKYHFGAYIDSYMLLRSVHSLLNVDHFRAYFYSIYSVFFNSLQRLSSKCCLHNHYNIT